MNGPMEGDTRESGRRIKCMEMGSSHGKMEGLLRGCMLRIKNMDLGHLLGKQVHYLYRPNGTVIRGNWENGVLNGSVEVVDIDGVKSTEKWKNGVKLTE